MELRSSSLRLKTAADDVFSCRSFTCFTYQQLFYKTSDVVTEEVFYTVTGTQGECVMALRMFITNPSLILLVIDNLLISAKLQYVLHHHACLLLSRHKTAHICAVTRLLCGGKTLIVALLYPFFMY